MGGFPLPGDSLPGGPGWWGARCRGPRLPETPTTNLLSNERICFSYCLIANSNINNTFQHINFIDVREEAALYSSTLNLDINFY